jgi:ribosomal-protein-alanine N-acetyltransferase
MSLIYDKFPVLEVSDKIILRELEDSDIDNFYHYITDPMVKKYICEEDVPKNLAQAKTELNYWRSLFQNKRSIYWGIAKRKNNELIGTCGFNIWSLSHKRVEISYDLARKDWGQGIMTKSLRAICDFAIVTMKVQRIQATVALDNARSIKLLNELGFQREGILRSYSILDKNSVDFYMYSLLPQDLFNVKV